LLGSKRESWSAKRRERKRDPPERVKRDGAPAEMASLNIHSLG